MEVRNAKGEKAELVNGMWYVGVNLSKDAPMIPAPNWHWGSGEIAQYVGDNEFYDEGCDEPTDMRRYDYIVESHMGRVN
jgi:hypothetical protein